MEKEKLFIIWPRNWSFCEGIPTDGWEKERRAGLNFALDGCIDVDVLCQGILVPNESEGVLYADFNVGEDGTALIGIGCNWCFELYCDGKFIKSTYETGNGSTYIFPVNNRIFFPITAGSHLLAIRIKRGNENWNFACGHVTKEIPKEPEIAYGPWLMNPDKGMVTIGFWCASALGTAVEYRKKNETKWKKVWDQRQGQILRRTYHAIPLKGLEAGAEYEYRIIAIHPDTYLEVQLGKTESFRAFDSTRASYSFFFTADLQFSLKDQHVIFGKMLEAAHAEDCDFFVLGGDVNSAFLPEDVIRGPFGQLCEYGAASKPIVYVRGNHELRGDYGDQFLDYFATNIGTTYDVLRLGDTAFMLLDSWEDKPAKTPGHPYCQWNLDDLFVQQEKEWFCSAVADEKWTKANRRIVLCHGAPYSHLGTCPCTCYNSQKITDPYFEGEKPVSQINFWLAGHVHRYLRTVPGTNDIYSTQFPPTPLKGGKSYRYPVLTVGGPGANRKIQASCFRVDADPCGFRIRSWDENGELLEEFRYENDGTCTEIKSLERFTVDC